MRLGAAYAFASSSMAPIVASSGSSLAKPEKMARSPISVSSTNVGRCVICIAWNSAVAARNPLPQSPAISRARAISRVHVGHFCRDFRRHFPISHLFAFAQPGTSKRQPDTIISETKILCRFRHAIRRQPLRKTWSYQSVFSMNAERIMIPLRR